MPEQQPQQIGRYRVTGQLGAGGMGVVHLAFDEHLQRKVAIKRLIRNPSSSTAHLRIRQEAKLLAQLNHSNIVQIYDVVEDAGEIALVMEYVDGCTLSQWQRERAPSLAQRLAILRQVCTGLARAHSIGIIHRDLKADNILVDRDNVAKITDFGIAKNWREESDLTREQHVAGSWGAMSPEQALGKPLDNRCDLFALGVLAYRLLTGQSPFGDHDSAFVIVERIVKSQHPPADKLNPELPAALSKLLDRLLEKEPDRRPLSASAVADELDAIQATLNPELAAGTLSGTATVTAESFHSQVRSRQRQRKSLLAASALAVAAAVAFASMSALLPASGKSAGKYIAIVAPNDKNFGNRETRLLGQSVLSTLKQDLTNRDGLLLIPYRESTMLMGRPLDDQARALNADLLLHPSLDCTSRQCELSLDLIDTDTMTVKASRSTQLATGGSTDSRARTLQQLGKLLAAYPRRGSEASFGLSDADYRRYLWLFDQRDDDAHITEHLAELEALQQRNPLFTPLYRLYSELVIDQRFVSRSMEAVERLEHFLEHAPSSIADHPDVLSARLSLAIQRQDRKRGEALLDQLRLRLPDSASYYWHLAVFHQHLGDYREALAAADRALELRRSYSHLVQKAMALTGLGEMDAARPLLQEALTLSESNINAVSLLAGNELDAGRPGETVRLLTSVGLDNLGGMDIYNLCLAHYIERQFGEADHCLARLAEESPGDAEVLLYRAEIANARERPEQARAFAEQALAAVADRDDWEGLLMQARAHAELGHAARAVEKLIRVGRNAPDDIYVNFARAQVYVTTGDLFSAKAHLRKTLDLGLSPIWFQTEPFAPVCEEEQFADLRSDYPALCAKRQQKPSSVASKGSTSA
ncbi:protein kinase domain-containing protein [Microbulbifer yueqingensis]|uniref:Serine/threonine protein kinase n=1 Tax=Microbulbifer yueqingensis TaxID=658219 RepID=A0A1G8XWY3_9GAMM|nr:serine/threonine-protein kinase [Microbulbifer yueqingensis]SDJ94986.1 Serine/threonine protein kinase [Microbulbifer yueqingensis]